VGTDFCRRLRQGGYAPIANAGRPDALSGSRVLDLAAVFGVHPLTVEDIRNDVRPKTEEFDAYTFTLVKDAELRRDEGTFEEAVLEPTEITTLERINAVCRDLSRHKYLSYRSPTCYTEDTMSSEWGSRVGRDVRPLVESFERIGSPWRLVVLDRLHGEELRFNQLKESTGAPASTLARVLDDLEADGLVDRRLEAESPVATYYRLTDKGRALEPALRSLTEWAEEWLG